MADGPADVVRALCITRGLATMPEQQGDWPCFTSFQPAVPDEAITVYDTEGTNDGRLMKTGVSIRHPGITIQIRAKDYQTGWAKANAIARNLETVKRLSIETKNGRFRVDNFSQRGDLVSVGQEPGKTRQLFTINATLTYTELP